MNPIEKEIERLENDIYACQKECQMGHDYRLLGRMPHDNRPNTDFRIDIMFIGLAPNPKYNRQRIKRKVFDPNKPAGRRIRDIKNNVIDRFKIDEGSSREESPRFWYTNCLKCSHPMWKDKSFKKKWSEARKWLDKCKPFLMKEIQVLQPKLIVTFGRKVQKCLGIYKGPLKCNHGDVVYYQNIPCVLSYHPTGWTEDLDWIEEIQFIGNRIYRAWKDQLASHT